jgi:hypothetical protein
MVFSEVQMSNELTEIRTMITTMYSIPLPICFLGNSSNLCALTVLRWELMKICVLTMILVLGGFVVALKDQQQTTLSIRIIQDTRLAPSL